MKRHTVIAALMLSLGMAALYSCVNEDYSLKNVDTTVTLLPGLTIPLDSTTDIPASDVIGDLDEDDNLITDGEDNYSVEFDSSGDNKYEIPSGEFREAESIDLPVVFVIRHSDLPEFLRKGQIFMHTPINIEVENPTDMEMYLSAYVSSPRRETVHVSGMSVKPGRSVVCLDQEEVKDMFCPFEDDVTVSGIKLTKGQASVKSAGVTTTSSDDSYEFMVKALLPLVFSAGDKISVDYVTDILDKTGVIDAIEGFGLDASNLSIDVTVANTFPFDFHLVLNTDSNGTSGSISTDHDIAAGQLGSPVETALKVIADLPDGIRSVDSIDLSVTATVPDKFTSTVSLNANQSISIKVKSVDLFDGFTLTL